MFKKGDATKKRNYRPVSILPCISKIFEGILIDQLQNYFEPLMSTQMSGFRKGFSCQTVLTDFIEMCKKYLDAELYTDAVFSVVSIDFDCVRHCVLIRILSDF